MANNYGFTSVNQQVTSRTGGQSDLVNSINRLNNKVTSGRVVDIILDENHPLFEVNGGWSSLGSIFFEKVTLSSTSKNPKAKVRALPLLPNLRQYPVINELVVIFELPSKDIGANSTLTTFYYLNPISIWNHPNLNAYPNELATPQVQDSENKSYQQIEAGQVRRSTDEEVKINYNSPLVGGSFVPSDTVRSLMSYAGDFILEGRFGNSIRFGSTISGSTTNYTSSIINNNWSTAGSSGEPITIIRNGQGEIDIPSPIPLPVWVPTVENINIDKSGITEIIGGPAGLTLIHRSVYEKLIKDYPTLKIKYSSGISDKQKKYLYNFWENTFDSKQGAWYGEDVSFCSLVRRSGFKLHALVHCEVGHHGTFNFSGKFVDTFAPTDEKSN